MSFLREVFSENGQGSASRIMMFLNTIGVLAWATMYVKAHLAIPDPATLAALGVFATMPYAANKTASAVSSFSAPAPNNGTH